MSTMGSNGVEMMTQGYLSRLTTRTTILKFSLYFYPTVLWKLVNQKQANGMRSFMMAIATASTTGWSGYLKINGLKIKVETF
jgi:hypothetical protein